MGILDFIVALISAAVLNGAPLMYGTSGEILTQKSGNMNLGVEGLMFMGGAFGLLGAFTYGNAAGENASGVVAVIIALLCAFAAGMAGSLISTAGALSPVSSSASLPVFRVFIVGNSRTSRIA